MWLLLIPTLLLLFYLYRKSQHSFFKNCGIPGPDPNWFFGNLLCFNENYTQILWIRDCTEKYGKVWGFYEGSTPCLVVSDPQVLQDVLVKHFSTFHARKLSVLSEKPKASKMVNMFNAQGQRWKRLRTIVTPAFSESKMRAMFPLVSKCLGALMCQLEERCQRAEFFDVAEFYKRMTLEVIGECAFGISLNAQRDFRADSVFSKINFLMSLIGRRPFPVVLADAFPPLAFVVRKFFRLLAYVLPSRAKGLQLRRDLTAVIEERRRRDFAERADLLQLMLDAELPPEIGVKSEEMGRRSLDEEEVISQSMLFLFVGYETISTALGFITHLLATHPDIQVRLQNEIDALYNSCADWSRLEESSDHLSGLTFMNQVILETLRLYPVAAGAMNRSCPESGMVCGVQLPAGGYLLCDILSLHSDPSLWGPIDPQSFVPDRFADEAKQKAFLAFGAGPRACIGRRFALMEIRAVLFRLFRRFSVRAKSADLQLSYQSTIRASSVDIRVESRNLPTKPTPE